MDEAQTALGVGLGQAAADQVLEGDDGGLRGPGDVEQEVRNGGREAHGKQ